MQYLETNISKKFLDITSQLPLIVENSFTYLTELLKLDKRLVTQEEFEELYGDEEIDSFEDDQLIQLEEFATLSIAPSFIDFKEGMCASTLVLNRRVRDFVQEMENSINLARDYSEAFIPLEEEEIFKVKRHVRNTIGHLSTFVYYQFQLDSTIDSIISGEDVRVDVNLYKYLTSHNLTIQNICLKVKATLEKYRPSLPIFEDRPELEDDFYSVAGPYIQDFEDLEDNLTLADVNRVIASSDSDVEDIIKSIAERVTKNEKRR